jgi:hypothetical protein
MLFFCCSPVLSPSFQLVSEQGYTEDDEMIPITLAYANKYVRSVGGKVAPHHLLDILIIRYSSFHPPYVTVTNKTPPLQLQRCSEILARLGSRYAAHLSDLWHRHEISPQNGTRGKTHSKSSTVQLFLLIEFSQFLRKIDYSLQLSGGEIQQLLA